MNLGPFSPIDIEPIKRLLETHKITYTFIVDEVQLKALTSKYTGNARFFHQGNKVFWFKIDDADFKTVEVALEKYGISAPTDGKYELGEDEDSDG